MSQLIARQVMGRLNLASSLVAPHGDIAGDLMQLASADRGKELSRIEESRGELCAAYGFETNDTQKPFAFAAGVAIIPLHGSLINRFGQSYGYVTGYNFVRSQFALAQADNDVNAIILDCNSYGGEVTGCFETADEIYAARGGKPVVAVIDANCYSACYAIASAADRRVITPSGGAGSIGAMAMHISMEKMLEEFGIKVTLIYDGAHKVDGNPFKDLPEAVRTDIQRGVASSRTKFAALVARNLGLEESVVLGTEAAVYRAEDALAIGLVDEIATPQQAVANLLNELSGSSENLENEMSTAPAATTATAAAPAVSTSTELSADEKQSLMTAERDRCSAILNCDAGKANPTLANHIAFKTTMSVDEAKEMLAASTPAQSAVAPVVAAAATAPVVNHFAAAMNNTQNPELDADGQPQTTEAASTSRVSSILSSYQAATGNKLG